MSSGTRYATTGDVHIAWAEMGEGPIDLVFCSAYVSHVEHLLAHPLSAAVFERLARFSRVILFDRRGSGLSDRVLSAPTLEEQMEDILAVMDAARSERAALIGFTGGAPLAILTAATHPGRCSALVLVTAFARTGWAPDYEWAPDDEVRESARSRLFASWGDGSRAQTMFPSAAGDPSFVSWFGALERLSAGPGDARHLFSLLDEVDVRDAYPRYRPQRSSFTLRSSRSLTFGTPSTSRTGSRTRAWCATPVPTHYPCRVRAATHSSAPSRSC